jgi:hypothetical protein
MKTSSIAPILALVAAALAAGCGPAVQNITVQTPGSPSATPAEATIVVVQPTTRFQSVNIFDGHGQLVGQLNDRSYTVLQVPAGETRLYAFPENKSEWADRIAGTVQAGRVYYATVSLRWGGISFLALNQRSRDGRWMKKDEYLSASPHVQMDPQRTPLVMGKLGETAHLFDKADAFVQKLDGPHQAERVIQPEDGI